MANRLLRPDGSGLEVKKNWRYVHFPRDRPVMCAVCGSIETGQWYWCSLVKCLICRECTRKKDDKDAGNMVPLGCERDRKRMDIHEHWLIHEVKTGNPTTSSGKEEEEEGEEAENLAIAASGGVN